MQEINTEIYRKKNKMKRSHNMSKEKKQKLNKYQKNYREAKQLK